MSALIVASFNPIWIAQTQRLLFSLNQKYSFSYHRQNTTIDKDWQVSWPLERIMPVLGPPVESFNHLSITCQSVWLFAGDLRQHTCRENNHSTTPWTNACENVNSLSNLLSFCRVTVYMYAPPFPSFHTITLNTVEAIDCETQRCEKHVINSPTVQSTQNQVMIFYEEYFFLI